MFCDVQAHAKEFTNYANIFEVLKRILLSRHFNENLKWEESEMLKKISLVLLRCVQLPTAFTSNVQFI